MPPKKQKKARKPRAKKPQPLPRSVQALLKYLGGSDVKLGSSRPQPAQVAQQFQPPQQQAQYAAPPPAAAAISKAPKAPARPRGRPPKATGNVIGQSPLASLAPAPQQVILQQPAQQQQETQKQEETQKQLQADVAAIKIKQEKAEKKPQTQTPVETLAFFQQQTGAPKFMGQFPTRSEFSAATKQPSLAGTTPSFGEQSMLQSMFKPQRYLGVVVRPSGSQASSERTLSVASGVPSGGASAGGVGDFLAQKFIQDISNPQQMPTKKLRGRPPRQTLAASTTAPPTQLQFEGQTAQQAIATFQAAKPARKPRAKKAAPVVLPAGIDPSTQVELLAGGGAAAAAPKQRRGKGLKELMKGGAQSE